MSVPELKKGLLVLSRFHVRHLHRSNTNHDFHKKGRSLIDENVTCCCMIFHHSLLISFSILDWASS